MAKIIKRGDKHIRSQTAQHKCSKCDSVIEFNRSDIRSDPRGDSWVECPVCGAFISSRVVFK